MRRTIPPTVAALAALVLPAGAAAQGPAPSPPPQATAPVPAPKLTVRRTTTYHGRRYVLPGQRFVVRGTLTPYTAGERLVVRVFRDGHKLHAKQVALQPAANGAGRFTAGFASGKAGALRIEAGSSVAHVRVLTPRAKPGEHGLSVRLLQRLLAHERYAVPHSGRFDAGTARAVLAFRKVSGMARTSSASGAVFRRLVHGQGRFRARFPSHGRHVEGDLTHQVLALVDAHGKVARVYTMSSGKPSTPTVLGHFRVYLKDPGYNSEAMYYSNYFIRGYAVHGYHDVPPYAASHGCLRVPIPDAVSIFRWIHLGTRVDVYHR